MSEMMLPREGEEQLRKAEERYAVEHVGRLMQRRRDRYAEAMHLQPCACRECMHLQPCACWECMYLELCWHSLACTCLECLSLDYSAVHAVRVVPEFGR